MLHLLQTLILTSPSFFSHNIFTPVRLHDGHVPRHPAVVRANLPRLSLGIVKFLSDNTFQLRQGIIRLRLQAVNHAILKMCGVCYFADSYNCISMR